MKYMKVELLVGIPDEVAAEWGSGCDQTFHGAGHFHKPEDEQYVITHTRGFLNLTDIELQRLKTSTFTEEGGI